MKYFKRNKANNSKKKNPHHNNLGPKCEGFCEGARIRGRVYKWSNKIMCKRCHDFYCAHFQTSANTRRKFLASMMRQTPQKTRKSFWSRIFG